ncbi:MAG: LPS export ABC transporter periplasmic protein LptC, partial [Neisseriaceae bacterium]|nr:LPS export ABC transporter periplasmic protein LptC [Neisseriaceae bacterium]
MKRLSSSSLLFPLTLSLLLGGTGFWLNRATDIQIEEVHLNRDEPQYMMNHISAARFDENGMLKDNLTAQYAEMY